MKKKPPYRCGGGYGWMDMSPDRFSSQMKKATLSLGKHIEKHKPDALAYCGSSGAALAFIAAAFFRIPILYVRKNNEHSHGAMVDGNSLKPIHSYMIVDDFIDTGATMKHIVRRIRDQAEQQETEPPDCLGVFLYAQTNGRKHFSVGDEIYDIFT